MDLLTIKGKCPGKGTSGEWEVPEVGVGGDRDPQDLAGSMVQPKWGWEGRGLGHPQSGGEGSRGGVVTRHA